MVLVWFCLGAAVWSCVWLYGLVESDARKVHRFETEGTVAQAEVVDVQRIRGEKREYHVRYRYDADGRQYFVRTKVRGRNQAPYEIGARIPVRFLASDPQSSWLEGRRPRMTPPWVPPLVSGGLVLAAIGMLLPVRSQWKLLADGRSVLAHVTKTEKAKHGESDGWKVYYEFRLLSGSVRTGHFTIEGKVSPEIGSTIPLVYDRDDPRRNSRYPLALVKV